jgi:hypothetical protein
MQTHCQKHRPTLISTKHTWTIRPSRAQSMPKAIFLPLRIYKAMSTDESAHEAPICAVVHKRPRSEQSLVEHAGMRERPRTCGQADPGTVSECTLVQARFGIDSHDRDLCLSSTPRHSIFDAKYRQSTCGKAHKAILGCHSMSLQYRAFSHPPPSLLLPFHIASLHPAFPIRTHANPYCPLDCPRSALNVPDPLQWVAVACVAALSERARPTSQSPPHLLRRYLS